LKVQDLEFCGADDLLTKVSNQLLLTGVAVDVMPIRIFSGMQVLCNGLVGLLNPGLKFNEHIEADGPTVFAHACKMGARRHRVEAQGLALPLGALAALAQDEKPGAPGGEAGGRGGLEQSEVAMTGTLTANGR
jgi:hypothetical protein